MCHYPLLHSFTYLASTCSLSPASGLGSKSSRQTEGPQGVPSTVARVCVHACQECAGASLNVSSPGHGKGPRPSSPQARILTFVHKISSRTVYVYTDNHVLTQARHPCAVHNLNTCTNQPSAASLPFPQAQCQIKCLEQKTWLLPGQWSLHPDFWCGLGEFQGSAGEQQNQEADDFRSSPRTCV